MIWTGMPPLTHQEMYKKILREAGQADILSYTYNECIALMQSGKAGIYYDATSIAPPLEAEGSAVRGKVPGNCGAASDLQHAK